MKTAKRYFDDFSKLMIDRLVQAGFPPCPGGYMATQWHYPLKRWIDMFETWIERPEPQAVLEATIFFDFRAVHGKLDVTPIEQIMLRAKDHSVFLSHLARTALQFQPPLGFFGQIRQKNGLVDLKKGGIAPIVGMARVYSLEAGSSSRPTPRFAGRRSSRRRSATTATRVRPTPTTCSPTWARSPRKTKTWS